MTSPAGQRLRFGFVTDIHYSPEEETGASQNTAPDLECCASHWQQAGAEFVVQLGDLISREGPDAECDLLEVKRMLDRYPGPMVNVPGNHCLAVPPDRFFRIMGIPEPYYSFASHGVRFVVLHGMDVSVLAEPENEADRNLLAYYREVRQAPFYCGAVGSRQLHWLADELDTALRNHEPVVVLSHLPLLEETTDTKHGLLWNHEEISDLLCRYPNVIACLSGHYHPGSYALRCGIHFVVLPGFTTRSEHPAFACGTIEIGSGHMRITGMGDTLLHDLEFSY
jgi:manganese-dependent ADP-ribose/CDP-alcohol diphosphatase